MASFPVPGCPETKSRVAPRQLWGVTQLAHLTGFDPSLPIAAAIFPFRTVMTEKNMKMGYVEVTTREPCGLFPTGTSARGHVYHFSEIVQEQVVNGLNSRKPSLAGALAFRSERSVNWVNACVMFAAVETLQRPCIWCMGDC